MSEKFKDIYRIESARLQNWDYGWNAPYFVTICTANRECCFGKIDNGKMILSDIGEIAEKEWIKTPEIRPDMNIKLDAYCVMPNHFHGIIIIGKNEYNTGTGAKQNRFAPQRKNLASIVRGFKSSVTMYARKNKIDFGWQTRFYDHIIRDDESYYKIQQYIENNAANWQDDKFYLT